MSENLNEAVNVIVEDANVITVPIDATLTRTNEAADAAAVGAALALKADASQIVGVSVNGETADAQGRILIDGSKIPVNGTGNTTLAAAVEEVSARTGEDIPISSEAGAMSIGQALEEAEGRTAADIPMTAEEGAPSIGAKIGAMDTVATANSTAIQALQGKAGDTIPLKTGGTETIAEAVENTVRSVNGDGPDAEGNVQVTHTMTADNLTSAQSQTITGSFVRRPSGGATSVGDGYAWLTLLRGNRTHVGYVPESLEMAVTPAPREEGETPITATIDREAFIEAVGAESGTYTMVYTVSWSTDPEEYGVTVTGEPESGDMIVITYTAENRGTIIQSDPQTFVSTGYNLYNHDLGYAIGLKYSTEYGFRVGGTYTAVKFSTTLSGTKQTLLPVDGAFDIPSSGYIWIEGGNATDTEVYMTWGDWQLGRSGSWEPYTEDVIDGSEIMDDYFPYGLMQVANVADEINFNTGLAVSRVERLAYSEENLAQAKASGRAYECDTDYIYLERAAEESHEFSLSGEYEVCDHGIEFFTDTQAAVYAVTLYGNNLKNKLERDVVTISAQTMGSDQKAQVRTNIGAASAADVAALNNNLQKKAWTLLKEQTTNARTYDQTVTIDGKFSDYNELKFVILAVSNSRVIASTDIPCAVFIGGGTYCCGSDILGITAFYNAVFIYTTDTTVEIATNLPQNTPNSTIKCRIYGR